MGSFFKFRQAVPKIFEFFSPRNRVFFRKGLEGTYMSGMAPKRRILKGFLQLSGNKHS